MSIKKYISGFYHWS